VIKIKALSDFAGNAFFFTLLKLEQKQIDYTLFTASKQDSSDA
jgi:hypothetical protein